MSRSNHDKSFYVDVGTSIVAVRCASNHDVVLEYDHSRHPFVIELAKKTCDRMNREAEIGRPRRNCEVGTAEEQAERFILFCLRNSFRGVCNDSCKFANVNRRLGWQEIGQARCFPFWAQMPYEEGGDR